MDAGERGTLAGPDAVCNRGDFRTRGKRWQSIRGPKKSFPEAIAETMQRPTMKFARCATMLVREIAISELRRDP